MARQQADELERLRAEMSRLGVLDAADLQHETERLRGETEDLRRQFAIEKAQLEGELVNLRQRVAVTQEEEILQEVGIYTYRHPLADSIAYREQLKGLQTQIKAMTRRDGGAIQPGTRQAR